MTETIVFGTTTPRIFQLNVNGTGLTVTLEIKTINETVVPSPPTVAWLDQAAGTVTVTGIGALALGRYLVRYKLTDGSGRFDFAPNGAQADIWRVVKVAAL